VLFHPVSDLHPWDKNPRTISPERFENLRRAIAADPAFLRLRPDPQSRWM
jgi:hypothetical protein